MADFADDAEATEELFRSHALAARKEVGPPPCGGCHYCSEAVPDGARFCDSECRDEWEREKKIRAQAPTVTSDE